MGHVPKELNYFMLKPVLVRTSEFTSGFQIPSTKTLYGKILYLDWKFPIVDTRVDDVVTRFLTLSLMKPLMNPMLAHEDKILRSTTTLGRFKHE